MKLKDHIAYLQTFDPELDMWHFWDESGECWPCKSKQGDVVFVGKKLVDVCKRRMYRFEHSDGKGKTAKKVFMVNEEVLDS